MALPAMLVSIARVNLSHSILTLPDALLAIGAYYNSFHERHIDEEHSHQRLFQQSLMWSENEMLERSLTQTSALLAHCFYFLATSQYERYVILNY